MAWIAQKTDDIPIYWVRSNDQKIKLIIIAERFRQMKFHEILNALKLYLGVLKQSVHWVTTQKKYGVT